MTHAKEICGDIWLLFFVLWILAGLRTKRRLQAANLRSRLSYGIPVGIGFALLFSDRWGIPFLESRLLPRTDELGIAAIVITLLGLAFAVWARVHLGQNWSSAPMIKQQHQLIRSGPYRFVRHPIYSGLLVAAAGTFLAVGRVRGALGVLIIWLGFEIKSRVEEQFMVQNFGPEYEEYRQTTGGIFPRISF